MIREMSSRQTYQSPKGFFFRRSPLIALLVATSAAAIAACGSDDSDDGANDTDGANSAETPLDSITPVSVTERVLPAIPPPPGEPRANTPNGLALPAGVLDWRVIGVVKATPAMAGMGADTLRVIVGNATAVEAARSGQTNPWPDGTQIAHLQWAVGTNPDWEEMIAPGTFARITLMDKSTIHPLEDGGWAYGVWNGPELRPPAAGFDRDCVNCHTERVAETDYVFTVPGPLPSQEVIDAADPQPNDVELPADILDWRVIGATSRETDPTPTVRVIVGNDIAVEAARAGDTNPWPDGAILAHYVWTTGENPKMFPGTVNAAAFNGFTVMVKDAEAYAADGGWAYGNWSTPELTAATDPTFDRVCVECHTDSVGAANDFVFTRPGAVPVELVPNPPSQPQSL
jgi:hypothetical protein